MAGSIRRPRVRVLINGTEIQVTTVSLKKNGYFNADTFNATATLFKLGVSWWLKLGADGTKVPVIVEAGEEDDTGAVTWEQTFDGLLESKRPNLAGGAVEIQCRDRTALFIDTKIYGASANQSAAEIITKLAKGHGLKVKITGAGELAGTIYSHDHTKLHAGEFSRARTEWDLICGLARATGNVAYVTGDTLYVKPADPENAEVWPVWWANPVETAPNVFTIPASNVMTLNFDHNLLASKDISVTVRSFHPKTNKVVEVTAGPKGGNKSDLAKHVVTMPGLTKQQAQAKANELYQSLTIHEYTMSFDAPLDWSLTPYRNVKIVGSTDDPLDQTFFVNEVTYKVDQQAGSIMSVVCKNHPPTSEVLA